MRVMGVRVLGLRGLEGGGFGSRAFILGCHGAFSV